MVNTTIAHLKPPSTFYRSSPVQPTIKWMLTASANVKPGHPVYCASNTTVDYADLNGASPLMHAIGIAGWKPGHALDVAYDNGESIPVIFFVSGLVFPTFIEDPAESRFPGHRYKLSNTVGNFGEADEDYSTDAKFVLEDGVLNTERSAWLRCI